MIKAMSSLGSGGGCRAGRGSSPTESVAVAEARRFRRVPLTASEQPRRRADWHTRGTRRRSGEPIRLNHALWRGRRQYLVMMGSGVRVPASAWPVVKSLQSGVFPEHLFSRHHITANDGVRSPWPSRGCGSGSTWPLCRHLRKWGSGARLTRPTGNALTRARWHTCGTRKDAPRGSRRGRRPVSRQVPRSRQNPWEKTTLSIESGELHS
jgi:hypothetical protein